MQFEKGLTNQEILRAEARFEIRFPPDLREYLSEKLPIGDNCPNWRSGPFEFIAERIRRPVTGILFDIEWNGFWWDKWGERPKDMGDALEKARIALQDAPKLIPVYAHRYLPSVPHEAGLPVISVWQTDIVVYYKNLRTLITNYFEPVDEHGRDYEPIRDPLILRQIPFWGALTYWSQWQEQPDWDPGLRDNQWEEEPDWDAGENDN